MMLVSIVIKHQTSMNAIYCNQLLAFNGYTIFIFGNNVFFHWYVQTQILVRNDRAQYG